jgi:hypothetical protein
MSETRRTARPSLRPGSRLGGRESTDLKIRHYNGRSKKRRQLGALQKVAFRGADIPLVAGLDFGGLQ